MVISAVAPYVGAWIETMRLICVKDCCWSHPTWVRGLKHANTDTFTVSAMSHPTWVRGLKHND